MHLTIECGMDFPRLLCQVGLIAASFPVQVNTSAQGCRCLNAEAILLGLSSQVLSCFWPVLHCWEQTGDDKHFTPRILHSGWDIL